MPITINGSGTVTGLSVGGLPDGSIDNADLATDAVSTSKLLNGAVTTAKLGSAEASGLAKAWVNFNGTSTVAIRASYNVSSITDNGTGDYTVNFTTAMVDANYAVVGMTKFREAGGSAGAIYMEITDKLTVANAITTTSVRIATTAGSTYYDVSVANVAIFR